MVDDRCGAFRFFIVFIRVALVDDRLSLVWGSLRLAPITFVEQLTALYDDLSDTHQVIIVGDFICHELEWLNSTHTDARGRTLREFCEFCGLSQLVTEPTRGAPLWDFGPSDVDCDCFISIGVA